MLMQITDAAPDDFEDVLGLLRQLWPDKHLERARLLQVFMQALDSEQQKYLVARTGQRVAGFMSLRIISSLWAQGNYLYIQELVVDEKFRNLKIGSSLLAEAQKFAEMNECKTVEVTSALYRLDAHRFYELGGFEKKAFHFLREISGS